MGVANKKVVDDGSQEYDLSTLANTIQPAQNITQNGEEYDLSTLANTIKPYSEAEHINDNAPAYQKVIKSVASPQMGKNFAKGLASVGDVALGALPAAVGSVNYFVNRFAGDTPQQAEQYSQKLVEPIQNPIGRAFGITEDPAYKNEASRRLLGSIGTGIQKGSQTYSEVTGANPTDVEQSLNAAMFLAPELAGKGYTAGKAALEKQFATKQGKTVAPAQDHLVVSGNEATALADDAKAAELQANYEQLHPTLITALEEAKKTGAPINKEALTRQNEALSLGVDLTKGQALQDPMLISQERNERGIKEKFVESFNNQNKQLRSVAENFKSKIGPENEADNYVTNSENIMALTQDKIDANNKIAKDAYQKLDEASGGKLQIDGKSVGNNALEALKTNDIEEYVPATILTKLKSYAEGGKEMNFNLFENLRTQLANESRKAERAGDGNTVHALSVVRNELENLPLTNEAGDIKALADDARTAFKSNRQLESNNQFYGKAARGSLDSANLIKSTVFGIKNDYFNDVMEVVGQDPVAKQHLQQGAMDYMIKESTDGSGNLNPMKMAKLIDDLDRNKRLEPLFGDNADNMRKFARVSRYTKSAPEGSFINYSGSTVEAARLIQQYGPAIAETVGAHLGVPYGGKALGWVGKILDLEGRKAEKQFRESTKPAAGVVGTKLSDVYNFGKETK